MSPRIGRTLGGFHHRVARIMTGRKPQRGLDGRWVYTLLEEAIENARLQEVDKNVSIHQNIVTQFISIRPIMDLCLAAERRMGARVSNWWWDQEGLDLVGMRTVDQ